MASVSILRYCSRTILLVNRCAITSTKWHLPVKRHFTTTTRLLAGRKFSKKHEWVETADGNSTIGITNYAQDSLGDIVYAQLPDVDSEFEQGEECGALESVKAASELYSPVSGTVVATNKEVEDQPGLINTSCYEKGWLFKMKLSKPEELDGLMDEGDYDKFVKAIDS